MGLCVHLTTSVYIRTLSLWLFFPSFFCDSVCVCSFFSYNFHLILFLFWLAFHQLDCWFEFKYRSNSERQTFDMLKKDTEPLQCWWKGLGHRLAYSLSYVLYFRVQLFKQLYLSNENGRFKLTQCILNPIAFFFSFSTHTKNTSYLERHSHYLLLAMHSDSAKNIFHTCGNTKPCNSIHEVFLCTSLVFYLFKSAEKNQYSFIVLKRFAYTTI